MKISVGISNRHIHLKKADFKKIFGNIPIEKTVDLKQPGNFATNHFVTIQTPKGSIEKVRVVGPNRKYTQVEISRTDAYKLGIDPPIRTSGLVEDAATVTIIGPQDSIQVDSCIIAERHIHITKELKEQYNLPEVVSLKVSGEKSGILEKVHLKITDNAYLEAHLDTDDGNAFLLKSGDEVEII